MAALDFITKSKIQSRVEKIVIENGDDDGFVKFEVVESAIISEFSEDGIEEARKQYNFMFGL